MYNQMEIHNLINSLLNHEKHLSYSSLSAFKKSPLDFLHYKFKPKEQTPAMAFGSMAHNFILEYHTFFDNYYVIDVNAPKKPTSIQINAKKPSDDTIFAIQYWENLSKEAGNLTLITNSDLNELDKLSNSLFKNTAAMHLVIKCKEFEKEYNFKHDNFLFKSFIDAEDSNIRLDLKIVQSAEPKKFQRDAIAYGYHIQAAMYELAGGKRDYYLIAVDRNGGVSVNKLSEELIAYGMQEINNLLENFNRCVLEDAWMQSYEFYSSRADGAYEFELPKYLNI
jgi:hypothetical protein